MNESNSDIEKNTDIKKDECVELKNIKYKTMLLGSANPLIETSSSNNLSNLEKFLENEKNSNKVDNWCKLDKTVKTKKLIQHCEKNKKSIKIPARKYKNF